MQLHNVFGVVRVGTIAYMPHQRHDVTITFRYSLIVTIIYIHVVIVSHCQVVPAQYY